MNKWVKTSRLVITIVLTLVAAGTKAQLLEVGGGVNYLSNGLHIMYQFPTEKRLMFSGGIRIMVNTYSLNNNTQNYVYYQNGYAGSVWEYLGLKGRFDYRIFGNRKFGILASGNALMTWHGLKQRSNHLLNITTGIYEDDVFYTKPGLALEATVGLNIYYNISPRIRVSLASGIGVVILNYSKYKRSLVTGEEYLKVRMANYQGRLDLEYVGLDGLPMLYAGVSYRLK